MFEKIIVSFDGSDHAEKALRVAADLAQKYDGSLEVVHVPEIVTATIAMGASAVQVRVHEEETRKRCAALLADAKEIATTSGCSKVSVKMLDGSPAEAVIARTSEIGADLIVAGRRGLGTLQGLLMGSVSQKLTTHAPCPVLTVH